jgi:hypothetical protein
MCWHNSHKASYRDSTGTETNTKIQSTHEVTYARGNKKITPKNNCINNITPDKDL